MRIFLGLYSSDKLQKTEIEILYIYDCSYQIESHQCFLTAFECKQDTSDNVGNWRKLNLIL